MMDAAHSNMQILTFRIQTCSVCAFQIQILTFVVGHLLGLHGKGSHHKTHVDFWLLEDCACWRKWVCLWARAGLPAYDQGVLVSMRTVGERKFVIKLVHQPAVCVEVQISLLMLPHTHTALPLLLEGVCERESVSERRESGRDRERVCVCVCFYVCVCKWNKRHTSTLRLPLSTLPLKLSILHPFYLFVHQSPVTRLSSHQFLCASSCICLYVSASPCSRFLSHSSESLRVFVCLVGNGELHTVAQEKAETETGEMGQERRTKLKRGQARGGRRDEEIRRKRRGWGEEKEETETNQEDSQTAGEAKWGGKRVGGEDRERKRWSEMRSARGEGR